MTRTAALLLAAASLAFVAACALAPQKEIVTEAHLPASPDATWAVLSDGARYGEWNPFIVSMEGEVREGARLRNTMQPEPGQTMTFTPKVLAAEPGKELRWIGRLGVPGLFDGEHYFLLSETETGTKLVHGEKFSGLLLWFVDVQKFEANLADMNAALARRLAPPSDEVAPVQ